MPSLASPLTVDTSSAAAVTRTAIEVAKGLSPSADPPFNRELFGDVEKLFSGSLPEYQANDLPYHDLQHNLPVCVAIIDLFVGRQNLWESPPFSHRQFELGLAAPLFHDGGYLKLRSDREGTGAKSTFFHVLGSCALAASHFSKREFKMGKLDAVLGTIRCTGSSTTGMNLRFDRVEDPEIASMVAKEYCLSQIATDDYTDEPVFLLQEFAESDAFRCQPASQRLFKSAAQLPARSTLFWPKDEMPKFVNDFVGFYRFINQPDGHNRYLAEIENNLDVIAQRHAASTA